MVNLGKITNEKDFQRLVNHLFAIECNSPAFIPSSPYIGLIMVGMAALKGSIPMIIWRVYFLIQSKWTQKNFDEAESHLRSEINKEIKKAIENKVEHLHVPAASELELTKSRL